MSDINNLLQTTEHEQQLFDIYKERYRIHNIPPEKISTNTTANWWEKNSKMLVSFIVALIIVIGSRTGWSIYEVNRDEGFPVVLSVTLAVLLVWSIEGFIAYYGLSRTRHIHISNFEKNIGATAMFVGLLLSAVAGLDYVIGIAQLLQVSWGGTVDILLSLLLSIGLTFVLYGIAEFAGRARWEHENMPQIEEANYQKALKEYNKQLELSWKDSPEYLTLMGEQVRRAEELKYDIDHAHVGRAKLRRERQKLELQEETVKHDSNLVYREFTGKLPENSPIGNGSGRQEVIECILSWVTKFGEMPRQVDVVNNTSVTKGYVSRLYNNNEFQEDLEDILREQGLFDKINRQ